MLSPIGIASSLLKKKKSPATSNKAKIAAESARSKAEKSRASLFQTGGGASGEEIDPDAVKSRNSLLGN